MTGPTLSAGAVGRPSPLLAPLHNHEVRVLWWSLEEHPADDALLGPQERRRAARLPEGVVRQRFVSRRTTVRRALGALTGREPAAIEFGRAECPSCGAADHGRPLLLPAPELLQISAASSGDVAALAVALDLRIGVDVEALREVDVAALGAIALTARERAHLDYAGHGERDALLLRCWTRKEALLKAAGLGLGGGPADVETYVDRPAPLQLQVPSPGGASTWTVHDMSAGRAALAVAHAGVTADVTCHRVSLAELDASLAV